MLAASRLFGISADRFELTYNGLDFDLLEPTRPLAEVRRELDLQDGTFSVATTGNLRAWKRVDLLLQAVALVDAPDVHCYIIGDGPDRERLEGITDELALRDRVRFVGKKADVADYLQAMDAFVLASGPEEAFGNSAIEAMAVGLPTIIFADGGGLLEHVEDGVTGFVVNDASQLADTLGRLKDDRPLARTIGKAGAGWVRQAYSLERMLATYARLYQRKPGAQRPPCEEPTPTHPPLQ